tara:strand:+ start:636 stop:770 length:135 start_codon:yes stop_codon:yes gene_type:complete
MGSILEKVIQNIYNDIGVILVVSGYQLPSSRLAIDKRKEPLTTS